ncbi:SDR family oxidoreductase [Fibrella forsythiae]|uniref:SDR family oxidoreductase n=1 Tax=Fibrella forsythiae TaxID=2817061 RepID=A0ABS3JIJ2_9BACT|nr:SDR family oxidoreductase [Fibrella forsythiae]MBO0949836.1 SDR family oxidoreductase [Fibrella forsythiae]
MILLTGATGQLGSATLSFLLKKRPADQIVALVRDANKATDLAEKGVTIRVGNYDDTASLDQAMQGIDKVLLIAGTDEDKRVQQHMNVIDAAKKAGVQLVAYTSRALADRHTLVNELMEGHFLTEDYLIASGLTYILFRNILYMDAIPQFVGPTVFETGIRLPAAQGSVAFALRNDMAEAMATVLAGESDSSTIYTLTAGESYSFADVAAALTSISGKNVIYTPVEKSAFEAQMLARGLPEQMVRRVTGFMTDIANGQEAQVRTDLEELLGRKPASLQEGLAMLYNL